MFKPLFGTLKISDLIQMYVQILRGKPLMIRQSMFGIHEGK